MFTTITSIRKQYPTVLDSERDAWRNLDVWPEASYLANLALPVADLMPQATGMDRSCFDLLSTAGALIATIKHYL